MRVKLFPNNREDSLFIAKILSEELVEAGFKIANEKFDLGIAIGGDGAFLHMVSECNFDSKIKYVGVNSGTLGFLQEVKPTELNRFIEILKTKTYNIENISYAEIEVITNKRKAHYQVLNEVVVRAKNLDTIYLDVTVDEDLLEKYVGDGLMISTPVGSTAYNLSGNGSIIYSGLHTLQITPLAPINNNVYRTLTNSVVLPENRVIKLLPTHRTKDLIIVTDGVNHNFSNCQSVEIKVSKKKLQCMRLENYNYTKIINDKFLN